MFIHKQNQPKAIVHLFLTNSTNYLCGKVRISSHKQHE